MRVGGARPPPLITFTITSKVAVYAPAEWADTLTLFTSRKYVLCGGDTGFLFTFFIRHKAGLFTRPGKTGFRFGNKVCAIVRIWKQRPYFLLEMSQLHFPFLIKFATPFIPMTKLTFLSSSVNFFIAFPHGQNARGPFTFHTTLTLQRLKIFSTVTSLTQNTVKKKVTVTSLPLITV